MPVLSCELLENGMPFHASSFFGFRIVLAGRGASQYRRNVRFECVGVACHRQPVREM
jgi:hypothetical protein